MAALKAAVRAPKAQRAVSVVTRAGGDEDIYIGRARGDYRGQGRTIKDDPKKYAARDNMFTGGWPGGEVALKEVFIKEPFDDLPCEGEGCDDVFPEDFRGDDDIYVGRARGDYQGKGRFMKGNAKKFAGRDNLLTGGWAGGEAALKLKDQLKLKKGDYVAIKGSGGIFAMFSKEDTRKTGTVTKVEFDGKGKVIVDVKMLPFDNVEQFNGDQVEVIQK